MKKLLCLLLAAVMVLSMAACAGNTPSTPETTKAPEEPVVNETQGTEASQEPADPKDITATLTFAQHRTDLVPEMEALIAGFNEEYPNITIKMETLADYANVMSVRVAGDEIPDIFEVNSGVIPKDKYPEYLMPVTSSRLMGNIACEDEFRVGDDVYAATEVVTIVAFMYSKPVWEQAGITSVPTTWDELVEDLTKIKELGGIIPLTAQYKTSWALTYWSEFYLYNLVGANYLDEMTETEIPFSNEKLLLVMNKLRELNELGLMEEDLMSSDWDLQGADFPAGLIGTYLTGSYAGGTMTGLGMDPADIGYFAMPDPTGGAPFVVNSPDWGICISKDCENPEAAMLFWEYLIENYASYTNSISPVKGVECTIPYINELLATDPVSVAPGTKDKYNVVIDIAGIHLGEFVQEYLAAEDPQTVVDKYNAKWASALADSGL